MNGDGAVLPQRGDVIANYLVGDQIGIGGMGVVFEGTQRSLDRVVAIKVPRPEVASHAAILRRFKTEALASSRVAHRNLVAIFDYGDTDGIPYLVMERVYGVPLGQLVFAGPLGYSQAADIVCQILDGLEAAHAAGIVHCDLKCDNVLVETSRDGTPWCRVIDFGLARCGGDYVHGIGLSGTPQYMAPELIGSTPPTVRSDIYAVGVILYELL